MSEKNCPICKNKMFIGLTDWHQKCLNCFYESADLTPAINDSVAHINIDEPSRARALQSLRIVNFESLLLAIKKAGKSRGRLLDVGCAHGWFLELARNCKFDVLGIEPDLHVYNATAQRGLPVRHGFFPEILSMDEQFDVVVFNDVFEHISDLSGLLEGCKKHLKQGGILVLNLPSSNGVFYRTACFFSKIGLKVFFERLWQKDLPSPHVHYFNLKNLDQLLIHNGFQPMLSGRLSTLRLKGLFTRISYTGNHQFFVRFLVYTVALLALPFLSIMPSDIVYTISSKKDKP